MRDIFWRVYHTAFLVDISSREQSSISNAFVDVLCSFSVWAHARSTKERTPENAELVKKGRELFHQISITTMTSTVTTWRKSNSAISRAFSVKIAAKTMCFQDLHISLNLGGSSSKETFWASFWFWYYGSKKSLTSFAYLRLSVHPPPTMKAIFHSWSRAVFDSIVLLL